MPDDAACLPFRGVYTGVMRAFACLTAFCFGAIAAASGQVSVELLLNQQQFLRDESLPVKVRVTNRSGQALKIGSETDWLSFTIEHRDGFAVPKLSDFSTPGDFMIDSSFAATRSADLMPFYDLQPGRYTISATVKLKQWNQEFSSPGKSFEIVRGTKIWEQEIGVPSSNAVPEVRKYILQQAQYDKQLMLYLRVTDSSERQVYRVAPVGPLVSFSRPETQVDAASQIHLLFQTGARAFRYAVYAPSGELVLRQVHEYARTRPTLRANDAGRIFVNGGTRRITLEDFPALSAASNNTSNEVSIPKP